MTDTLLAGFVAGGFAAAVLVVLWLLVADSQPDSLQSFGTGFELHFGEESW